MLWKRNCITIFQKCIIFFFQVVDTSKSIADVPEWFKGSRLNYAENLLKHKDNDKIALYAASKKELMACIYL